MLEYFRTLKEVDIVNVKIANPVVWCKNRHLHSCVLLLTHFMEISNKCYWAWENCPRVYPLYYFPAANEIVQNGTLPTRNLSLCVLPLNDKKQNVGSLKFVKVIYAFLVENGDSIWGGVWGGEFLDQDSDHYLGNLLVSKAKCWHFQPPASLSGCRIKHLIITLCLLCLTQANWW